MSEDHLVGPDRDASFALDLTWSKTLGIIALTPDPDGEPVPLRYVSPPDGEQRPFVGPLMIQTMLYEAWRRPELSLVDLPVTPIAPKSETPSFLHPGFLTFVPEDCAPADAGRHAPMDALVVGMTVFGRMFGDPPQAFPVISPPLESGLRLIHPGSGAGVEDVWSWTIFWSRLGEFAHRLTESGLRVGLWVPHFAGYRVEARLGLRRALMARV